MKKRLFAWVVPIVVATFVAGCGGDDATEPAPPAVQGPPDLSGTYNLASFTEGATGGVTLTPPIAVGTFTLSQNASSGDTATGTLSVSITVTNPLDGSVTTIDDQGTFMARTNGSWGQTGRERQALGTYTLEGNVLTITLTEPPPVVSTTVWQRQ